MVTVFHLTSRWYHLLSETEKRMFGCVFNGITNVSNLMKIRSAVSGTTDRWEHYLSRETCQTTDGPIMCSSPTLKCKQHIKILRGRTKHISGPREWGKLTFIIIHSEKQPISPAVSLFIWRKYNCFTGWASRVRVLARRDALLFTAVSGLASLGPADICSQWAHFVLFLSVIKASGLCVCNCSTPSDSELQTHGASSQFMYAARQRPT
jgi:hypothetical protein